MKLLITADLHFRIHWFRWLIEQAPDFDLVCFAGDFRQGSRPRRRLGPALADAVRVFSDLHLAVPCVSPVR